MAKIMIIDDEDDLRDLVEILLEKEGHEVIKSENGEKALEILEQETPNLMLLDINMPGLNGWETLEEMEKRGFTNNSPVVMFTIEELTFVKMLKKDIEGLVGYIEKPFDRDELINLVQNRIERTKRIRKLSKKIEKSPDGGEDMAEAYKAWSRSKMIHERFLEKLNEMESSLTDEKKLAQIKNMKKGEKKTIDDLDHKRKEIIRKVGLELQKHS